MSDDVTITPEHNVFRLLGTRAFIDTGDGTAMLELYDCPRVPSTEEPLTQPNATIPLAYPCGVIDVDALVLAAAGDGFVTATGSIVWGRLRSRDGLIALDGTVRAESDPDAGETFVIPARTIYEGGITRLVEGVLE